MIKLVLNVLFIGLVLSSKISKFAQESKCPESAKGICLGYSCSNDNECFNPYLTCASNKCLRKLDVNCLKNDMCASRYCENNRCSVFSKCSNFCPANERKCKDYCCIDDSDCNNNQIGCFNTKCKRKIDVPCQYNEDCGTGWCAKHICANQPTIAKKPWYLRDNGNSGSENSKYNSFSNTGNNSGQMEIDPTWAL